MGRQSSSLGWLRRVVVVVWPALFLAGCGLFGKKSEDSLPTASTPAPTPAVASSPTSAPPASKGDATGPIVSAADIRNSDIKWTDKAHALAPELSSRLRNALPIFGASTWKDLVQAMLDDQRYVAAHVILTYKMALPFLASDEEFNGLKVHLVKGQPPSYAGTERKELYRRWKEVVDARLDQEGTSVHVDPGTAPVLISPTR